MKYEMIFGDEMLFDGAPEDCVLAVRIPDGEFIFYIENNKSELLGSFVTTDDGVVKLAMRRIIKEPKRWTWEDKKAGRLPEVGAELIHKTKGICYFVGVGLVENACWALKLQSGLIYIAEKSWCQPIETPAEKAQREEDEFVDSLIEKGLVYTSFYVDGIRAAYRKLKGEK